MRVCNISHEDMAIEAMILWDGEIIPANEMGNFFNLRYEE